jgi:two-component system chemotaxis response regulator CheB
MDGFTFLRISMQKSPLPIIVVSSQHQQENVFKALELGAVDFVAKPTTNISERLNEIAAELIQKLRAAHRTDAALLSRPGPRAQSGSVSKLAPPKSMNGIVLIGASTGGPTAIQRILERMPILPVSIIVAQHMPAGFTKTFAERLNRSTAYVVAEAQDGDALSGGKVWIAPGGMNTVVLNRQGDLRIRLEDPTVGDRFVPSIDRLFLSVAALNRVNVLSIVLTGMGDDGARGALALKNSGGHLYVESEETAVVNGMPREAAKLAAPQRVLPVGDFPKAIEQWSLALRSAANGNLI